MDHKELLAGLSQQQLGELLAKNNRLALIRFGTQVVTSGLLAAVILLGVPFWPLLMLPLGLLLIFQFTLLHETVHSTPFEALWLNRGVGRLCGFIIMVPPLWFQYFHLAHHRHTQDPEKDPELEGGKPDTLPQYFWHVSGIPLWVSLAKVLLVNAFGKIDYAYVPDRAKKRVRLEARLTLLAYLGIASLSTIVGSPHLIWIWVVPLLIGQPFLRLYLLAEHGRCPMVANMLMNTRTTYTNRFVRWLAWNMPYHAEHHALPKVPFHKLPALNELTREHLTSVSNGYVEFHTQTLENIRSESAKASSG